MTRAPQAAQIRAVRRTRDRDEDGMRLPGTRYQEHGWEQVRKLLGQCSLQAFAHGELARLQDPDEQADALDQYVDAVAAALRASARCARAQAPANSYGETVFELSLALVCELRAHPGHWQAFAAAVAGEFARSGQCWAGEAGGAVLRKKVNDMFAVLRDKVDADNYQVACGRPCSANKIYAYRMLDTAYGELARLFGAWQENAGQVGAILGRAMVAIPIEARQMKAIGQCKAEWIMRWSETLEQFGGSAGPLHTKSKRFASLKNSPEKIQAMLREIGDYEELSSNRDSDWLADANEAADWLEDLWRVAGEARPGGEDQIAPPAEDDFCLDQAGEEDLAPPAQPLEEAADPRDIAIATSLSLPPRYMEVARSAQDQASWMVRTLVGQSLSVRLAVFLKMLGSFDDSYPGEWLDPATGELPTMEQLAALDRVSLPTLRKRRNEAIALLQGALPP
jgi:hypothetical protein